MKKKILYIILVLIVSPANLFSQEAEIISPFVQLYYLKSNDQIILQTTLTYSDENGDLPLPGMEIYFFSGADNQEQIATTVTNSKGVARVELPANVKFSVGSDGMWTFSSEFKGNDTIEAGSSETSVKDVTLKMDLTLVDSVKTVSVSAFVLENGKEVPVGGETLKLYVPRMFSNLLISDLTLDDTGTAILEFPSDLPGDKDGNLTILSKFEDHATFGNVEQRQILNWGVPTEYSVPKTHRALWTKTAPKWMIYILSILLAGVWGHYLFAFISLIRIKLDANRKAKKEYKS